MRFAVEAVPTVAVHPLERFGESRSARSGLEIDSAACVR